MKSFAALVVKHRIAVFCVMIVITLISIVFALKVGINSDMTKYLPDDSDMKIGTDIMEEQFDELALDYTIRVMAEGLSAEEEEDLLAALEAIRYVESVDHDDTDEYHEGDYSLFIINTSYDYGTEEESSIEAALAKDFGEYGIVYKNDNDDFESLSPVFVAIALSMLLVILFVMSESWIEPFLYLFAIGCSILINAGTNIILGEISNVTYSIAAILQLVLSLDYSVILINRYRQEKMTGVPKTQAMSSALANAFSSIAGSSFTTVVGLLALVFMNFKIGKDLGIVLAKGVFLSMVSVVFMLPFLIVTFDSLIEKTAKKALNIPTGALARFCYRARYVMPFVFIAAFIVFSQTQNGTKLAFYLEEEDPIAEVFPKNNALVLIYENDDETNVLELAEALEENEYVTKVLSYPSLLGKEYTADKLTEAIKTLQKTFDVDMGDISDLDPALLSMIYYNYYDGTEPEMTMSEFLNFLIDEVIDSDAFADMIDDDMRSESDSLKRFADADGLTEAKSIEELAGFFEMDADDVKALMVYYYSENGGADPGYMTVPAFVSFLLDDVAVDPDYSSMIDDETLKELKRLSSFTNKADVTAQKSASDIASLLEMDEDTAELLFMYYYAKSNDYSPGTMTLSAFVSFLRNDVANDPDLGSMIDSGTKSQLDTLEVFTDKGTVTAARHASDIASILGMDASTANLIFTLYSAGDVSSKTMTLSQFVSYLNSDILNNSLFSSYFDDDTKAQLKTMETLITLAVSGQKLSVSEMAQTLGLDETTVTQLYFLYLSTNDEAFIQKTAQTTMTLTDFISLVEAQSGGSAAEELEYVEQIVAVAASGQEFSSAEMAAFLGMDAETMTQLYFLYFSNDAEFMREAAAMTMTPLEFLTVAGVEVPDEVEQMLSGFDAMDAASLAQLFSSYGIDENTVISVFGLTLAAQKTITLPDMTDFLVNTVLANDAYAYALDDTAKAQIIVLNSIAQAAVNNSTLTASELAGIFGMEEGTVLQLFGLALAADEAVALPDFTGFLVDTVLADEAYASSFDPSEAEQLVTLNQIVQTAASGQGLGASSLASLFGMDADSVTLIFKLYFGDADNTTMSLEGFIDYILSDFANDSRFSAYMDSSTLSQLRTLQQFIKYTVAETQLSYTQMASIMSMDSSDAKTLYTFREMKNGAIDTWTLSVRTVVGFILDNSDTFSSSIDADSLKELETLSEIIESSVNSTAYSPERLSKLLEMDSSDMTSLYLLYTSRHGDISSWKLSVETMIDFLCDYVLDDPDYSDMFDADTPEELTAARELVKAVIGGENETSYSVWEILSAVSDEMELNTIRLLFLYYASLENSDELWTLSVEELINYLCDTILDDERFSDFIDADMRQQLLDARETLDEGVEMLKGAKYSRMILYTHLPDESDETTEFIANLHETCAKFSGSHYLIGTSEMNYEMRLTFDAELQRITILTSVAIFLIVLATFRSFIIPLILVLLVQCGVYVTVTVVGIQGYNIYYLALLIVECILMGATIDYGILFTNYYREKRLTMEPKESITGAYANSIHTIMTSGLIIVVVTGILGYTTSDPTIAQVLRTISTGSFCTILMILFILPGILTAFDRFIAKKKQPPL